MLCAMKRVYVVCQIICVNTHMGVYIDVLFENEFIISIESALVMVMLLPNCAFKLVLPLIASYNWCPIAVSNCCHSLLHVASN